MCGFFVCDIVGEFGGNTDWYSSPKQNLNCGERNYILHTTGKKPQQGERFSAR